MQVDFKVIKTKNSLLLQRKLTQKIIIATAAVNFTIISFPKKTQTHSSHGSHSATTYGTHKKNYFNANRIHHQ